LTSEEGGGSGRRGSKARGSREGTSEETTSEETASEGLTPSSYVEKFRPDPEGPPKKTRVLTGILGRSDKEEHLRLYSDITLEKFVEFREEDILGSEQLPMEEPERTRVWVKVDAPLEGEGIAETEGMGVRMEAGHQFGPGVQPGFGGQYGLEAGRAEAGAGAVGGAGAAAAGGGAPQFSPGAAMGAAPAGGGGGCPSNDDWHYVTQGESLWSIAQSWYGNGSWWTRLWRANRNVVPNPNFLQTDIYLRIPWSGFRYTTRQGDTLWAIAQDSYHNGNAWYYIWQQNQALIPNPDFLPVGITICVP
jgi:hypothetical protein